MEHFNHPKNPFLPLCSHSPSSRQLLICFPELEIVLPTLEYHANGIIPVYAFFVSVFSVYQQVPFYHQVALCCMGVPQFVHFPVADIRVVSRLGPL